MTDDPATARRAFWRGGWDGGAADFAASSFVVLDDFAELAGLVAQHERCAALGAYGLIKAREVVPAVSAAARDGLRVVHVINAPIME